jgi:ribosome-associated protein
VDAAGERQAVNIVLLDVHDLCSFADYFVICSGESQRQIRAIFDEVEKSLKTEGNPPFRQEGSSDSGWLLLDYGNVIVHIFGAEEREFYDLDGFWREAKTVLNIQ